MIKTIIAKFKENKSTWNHIGIGVFIGLIIFLFGYNLTRKPPRILAQFSAGPSVIIYKSNYEMVFMNGYRPVGKLIWRHGEFKFEGMTDPSAVVFFNVTEEIFKSAKQQTQ